jgi:transcriptional/translational regulatory protein YebC/TACO1
VKITDEEEKAKVEKLFNDLDDNDDVVEVYSNIDF